MSRRYQAIPQAVGGGVGVSIIDLTVSSSSAGCSPTVLVNRRRTPADSAISRYQCHQPVSKPTVAEVVRLRTSFDFEKTESRRCHPSVSGPITHRNSAIAIPRASPKKKPPASASGLGLQFPTHGTNIARNSRGIEGMNCGAQLVAQHSEQKTGGDDLRLAEVIFAWSGLSERTKRKIIAAVEADGRERQRRTAETHG